MRFISVAVNDKETNKNMVLSFSILKNNVKTIDDLKFLIRGAVDDFYKNKKIDYRPKEITWKNLDKIPVYITQENGFKLLRVYSEKEVFVDDFSFSIENPV